MAESNRSWTIDLDVRDDAERMFVPRAQLPAAVVGDTVTARTHRLREVHRGLVIDLATNGQHDDYLIVEFERPATTS